MQTNDMSASLEAIAIVKNSLASLRAQHKAILDEENALIQKKKELKAQPVPIEDAKQALVKYIDARAALFLSDGQWERNLRQFIYPNRDPYSAQKNVAPINYDEAMHLSDGDKERQIFPREHPKLVIPDLGLFNTTDVPLLFFFGDIIKEKICAYFETAQIDHERHDIGKVGMPIAERTLEIERIEQRISELVSQRTAIDLQIKSLSV